MYVLALDTTTALGSSAVLRADDVMRLDSHEGERAHASHVPAVLMRLLEGVGLRLSDIEVFAVAIGPGSFTGLRVGIATMQGLAFATGRPLVGVSTLDVLAGIAGGGRVATWVEAWRGEVYAQTYHDSRALTPPRVAHPSTLLDEVREPTTFIGSGAASHAALIEHTLGPLGKVHREPVPPLAGLIGLRARAQVLGGDRPGPDAIRPLYVSRPQPGGAPEPGRD